MSESTGLRLDDNFDLVVGSTGDIDTTDGPIDELKKDLALRIADLILHGNPERPQASYLGRRLTGNEIAIISTSIEQRVVDDSRVDEILSITINDPLHREDRFGIDIEVESIYGPTEFFV